MYAGRVSWCTLVSQWVCRRTPDAVSVLKKLSYVGRWYRYYRDSRRFGYIHGKRVSHAVPFILRNFEESLLFTACTGTLGLRVARFFLENVTCAVDIPVLLTKAMCSCYVITRVMFLPTMHVCDIIRSILLRADILRGKHCCADPSVACLLPSGKIAQGSSGSSLQKSLFRALRLITYFPTPTVVDRVGVVFSGACVCLSLFHTISQKRMQL